MKLLKGKGQSTLEYVVVLLGILGAIMAGVAIFAPKDKDTGGLKTVFNNSRDAMNAATNKIGALVP